jgi:putative transposase
MLVSFSVMPRSIRIEFPGAFYHVMARGNRREAIFKDEEDHKFFLHALSQVCKRTGWLVHAWVLMGNHYHLFIQTPEANLVSGMKWLQNTYTRRFNIRHRAWGRVFGDRYKAIYIDGEDPLYYQTLMDYIHLNPIRAGLVGKTKGTDLLDYPWSSLAGGYALPPSKRAPWLAAEYGLKSFGLADTAAGRKSFVERLEQRAEAESRKKCGLPPEDETQDGRMSHLRRGWYWGAQAFREKMLKWVEKLTPGKQARAWRSSLERQTSHGETEAQRLLKEGLAKSGMTRKQLLESKSTARVKVELAKLLRQKTTVSQSWLAENLGMKSAANVGQILNRETKATQLPQPTKKKRTNPVQLLPKSFSEWLQNVKL